MRLPLSRKAVIFMDISKIVKTIKGELAKMFESGFIDESQLITIETMGQLPAIKIASLRVSINGQPQFA